MAGAGFKTFAASSVLTSTDVNTYLMQQAVMVFATAAARTAAITAPSEGMVTYLSDSNILQVYTGASWLTISDDGGLPVANGGTGSTTAAGARQNLGTGLTKIIPTSVTYAGGTGTTTNGVASASSCTSVTLNGVFTTEFQYYVVKLLITGSTADIYMRLAAGGTPDSTTNWEWAVGQINSAAAYAAVGGSTTTYGWITRTTGALTHADIYISEPHAATNKTFRCDSINGMTHYLAHGYQGGGVQRDGIQIYPSSGNISGTITVYGFNK